MIGPMATKGAFVAGALSGYGTMGASATGALVAAWAWARSCRTSPGRSASRDTTTRR